MNYCNHGGQWFVTIDGNYAEKGGRKREREGEKGKEDWKTWEKKEGWRRRKKGRVGVRKERYRGEKGEGGRREKDTPSQLGYVLGQTLVYLSSFHLIKLQIQCAFTPIDFL